MKTYPRKPNPVNPKKSRSILKEKLVNYDSGEHDRIFWRLKLPNTVIKNFTFTTIDGKKITIDGGTIVALADFTYPYSVWKFLLGGISTIAHPANSDSPEKVFVDYYNKATQQISLPKILKIFDEEEAGIDQAERDGLPPSQFYQKIAAALNRKYFFADPRYVVDSLGDYDHFYPDSLIAYRVGRNLAFKIAQEAYNEDDQEKRKTACAYLFFAMHFYTDTFSSGHLVTPRQDLKAKCGGYIGAFLSKRSHDEACVNGVNCFNEKNGQSQAYKVYGDGYLFDKESAANLSNMRAGIEAAFKDLDTIFTSGEIPKVHSDEMFIPTLLPPDQQTYKQLFIESKDGKPMLRRKDIYDPFCSEYTEKWSVLGTLIKCWLPAYFFSSGKQTSAPGQENKSSGPSTPPQAGNEQQTTLTPFSSKVVVQAPAPRHSSSSATAAGGQSTPQVRRVSL